MSNRLELKAVCEDNGYESAERNVIWADAVDTTFLYLLLINIIVFK